jgi:hypothetical protein
MISVIFSGLVVVDCDKRCTWRPTISRHQRSWCLPLYRSSLMATKELPLITYRSHATIQCSSVAQSSMLTSHNVGWRCLKVVFGNFTITIDIWPQVSRTAPYLLMVAGDLWLYLATSAQSPGTNMSELNFGAPWWPLTMSGDGAPVLSMTTLRSPSIYNLGRLWRHCYANGRWWWSVVVPGDFCSVASDKYVRMTPACLYSGTS